MFCTTLRRRPEFAPILPSLTSSQSPKWQGTSTLNLKIIDKTNCYKEKSLDSYDIALPLPRGNTKPDLYRLLLLSESDIEPISRIERLCHITGGRQIGVVFLLKEQFTKGNGMMAYLNLQARFVHTC